MKETLKEAMFWKKLEKNNFVQCQLCPRNCKIAKGKFGNCRVRKNIDGKLYALNYSKPCTVSIDPIEKKPFFHFHPGSRTVSVATVGCNFHCKFCFTPETIIVTEEYGSISIKDFFDRGVYSKSKKINDKIITHNGRTRNIVKFFKHNYKGDLITIKPMYSPKIRCTPSHSFFVSENPASGKIKKVEARDLKKDHYLAIPKQQNFSSVNTLDTKQTLLDYNKSSHKTGTWKITPEIIQEILKLKKAGKTSRQIGAKFDLHPTYVRALFSKIRKRGVEGLFKKDCNVVENGNYVRLSEEHGKGVPKNLKINKNLAKLFGYYCAEGHVTKNKNRPNSHSLVFSFGKKETKLINDTSSLIEKIFDIEPEIRDRRTTTTVEIKRTSIALLFKTLCGQSSKTKKVPHIFFKSNPKIINSFLDAYISGDGWIGDNIISTNTVSRKLAFGIYQLFLQLGLLPSFYVWKPNPTKIIENRRVNQSTLYYVKLQAEHLRKKFLLGKKFKPNKKSKASIRFVENKNYYFIPIHKLSTEKYNGPVYNLEVKEDHSYLANFVAVGNCQNFKISQAKIDDVPYRESSPEQIVNFCLKNECKGISYTYTEPTIFYEYAYDTAKLAHEKGLYNTFVSNGYINEKPLRKISKYLDAMNMDLKAFTDKYYKELCRIPSIEPVKKTAKLCKELGIHLEITTLIIPGYNDNESDLKKLSEFVAELGEDTPLHFSRFFPYYKMQDTPETPMETLRKARDIALDTGLNYVYIGNVFANEAENTYCPECGETVIGRVGFNIKEVNLVNKTECSNCGAKINVVV